MRTIDIITKKREKEELADTLAKVYVKLATTDRYKKALEKIVDEMSHKDPTYNEILSVAQEALKKISA